MSDTPKLAEIAQRIGAHLARMEYAQPNRGGTKSRYWKSGARVTGAYVTVWYISYQWHATLTKANAWRYLQWLDAGNEGQHYEALRDAA